MPRGPLALCCVVASAGSVAEGSGVECWIGRGAKGSAVIGFATCGVFASAFDAAFVVASGERTTGVVGASRGMAAGGGTATPPVVGRNVSIRPRGGELPERCGG